MIIANAVAAAFTAMLVRQIWPVTTWLKRARESDVPGAGKPWSCNLCMSAWTAGAWQAAVAPPAMSLWWAVVVLSVAAIAITLAISVDSRVGGVLAAVLLAAVVCVDPATLAWLRDAATTAGGAFGLLTLVGVADQAKPSKYEPPMPGRSPGA